MRQACPIPSHAAHRLESYRDQSPLPAEETARSGSLPTSLVNGGRREGCNTSTGTLSRPR